MSQASWGAPLDRVATAARSGRSPDGRDPSRRPSRTLGQDGGHYSSRAPDKAERVEFTDEQKREVADALHEAEMAVFRAIAWSADLADIYYAAHHGSPYPCSCNLACWCGPSPAAVPLLPRYAAAVHGTGSPGGARRAIGRWRTKAAEQRRHCLNAVSSSSWCASRADVFRLVWRSVRPTGETRRNTAAPRDRPAHVLQDLPVSLRVGWRPSIPSFIGEELDEGIQLPRLLHICRCLTRCWVMLAVGYRIP
jgi:hypothetical protein